MRGLQKEEHTMRKTLIALAAATGILGGGSIGASALTLGPMSASDQARPAATPAIQKADWYCGPRCQYGRERRWEEHRRWENGRHWRNDAYPRYGYNRGYNGNGNYGYYR
jgi:hypothetical protein